MSVKYALYPNHLTDDPSDHMAVVQDQRPYTMNEITDLMINRGSTVTKAEVFSVMEEYEAAVEQILADGGSINTPLMRIAASIQGVFNNRKDGFDPERHYVRLNVIAGSRLSEIAGRLSVEKVDADSPEPKLQSFLDVVTDTTDETLTPGGVGELEGSLLKLDPEDNEQGVFIIAEDGTETRAEKYVRNMPANVIFMIPDGLAAGTYAIELRTILQNTNNVRSGRLRAQLVVT